MRFLVGISLSVGLLVLWPSYVSAVTIAPISVGTSLPIIGDAFYVTASASGGLAGTVYFVKCRIGPTSSSLSEGQTRNPQTSQWLDDTGSTGAWADMPQLTIGQDGTWQGDMECRIKNGAVDEAKALFLRACLNVNNSCGTSFQSASSLALNPIVPTPTPTPVPTATPTPSPTPVPTSTPEPTPTKTPTPTPSPKATATPTPTITPVMTTLATSTSAATPSRRPTPSPEATLEHEPSVLGESVVSEESSPSSYVQNTSWKPIVISLLLIAMGLAILSGFYTWKIAREKYLSDILNK